MVLVGSSFGSSGIFLVFVRPVAQCAFVRHFSSSGGSV